MDLQKPTYLVDWYAFFGIERDADLESIKATCRRLIGLYHPDKYAHLAPEFAKQAERKQTLINEGQAILTDPEKRAAYDAQLASWDGPLSRDGVAIEVIGREPMSPLRLLQSVPKTLEDKMQALAMQASGYNSFMFEYLEKRATVDDKLPSEIDPELRLAYSAALAAKDIYLAMMEEGMARNIGMDIANGSSLKLGTVRHAEEIKSKLEAFETGLDDRLSQHLLGLSATDIKLLPGPGAEPMEASPDNLARLREVGLKRFQALATRLRILSVERQAVIDERLKFMDAEYVIVGHPKAERLMVLLDAGELGPVGIGLQLEGDHLVSEDLSDEELRRLLSNPDQAVAEGWSVVRIKPLETVDPQEQIEEVANRHFGPLLDIMEKVDPG